MKIKPVFLGLAIPFALAAILIPVHSNNTQILNELTEATHNDLETIDNSNEFAQNPEYLDIAIGKKKQLVCRPGPRHKIKVIILE